MVERDRAALPIVLQCQLLSISRSSFYDAGADRPERFGVYYDRIYDLVGAIVEKLPDLRENAHPKWQEIDPLDLSKVNWPAHTQAVKAITNLQPGSDGDVITKDQICKMFDTC